MDYRILYGPYKTLEEQDKAEKELKFHAEMISAIEEEQQELLIGIIENTVEYMPLKLFDE